MTTKELFEKGLEAYNADRYEEALSCFQEIAAEDEEAQIYEVMTLLNLGSEISATAFNSDNTETMVRGQHQAVRLADESIRKALKFLKEHPESKSNCAVAAFTINQAFSVQYTLIANGFTTAYVLTKTTTHLQKAMMGDTLLWEEITGTDTDRYVSLQSSNLHDYHVFGPDEKTKRVQESKRRLLNNAIQVATILTYMGREYDAHMLRATVACEMAECENGDRTMLLAADWFIWQAQDLAKDALSEADYNEWRSLQASTIESYMALESKFNALLRGYRRSGRKPALQMFYQPGDAVPNAEDCFSYTSNQEALKVLDEKNKGNGLGVFLSVFAQAATVRMIPPIILGSVVSLFFGGLFSAFTPGAGLFIKLLIFVWMAFTLIVTFVRSITDSDGLSGKELRIFQAIMVGTALLFSINFIVALIVFLVLKVASKRYK